MTLGKNLWCDNPDPYDVFFIMATHYVKLGSNLTMNGGQLISGEFGDIGSNEVDMRGVSFLSGGHIKFGSQWDIRGCVDNDGGNLTFDFGGEDYRLVN